MCVTLDINVQYIAITFLQRQIHIYIQRFISRELQGEKKYIIVCCCSCSLSRNSSKNNNII